MAILYGRIERRNFRFDVLNIKGGILAWASWRSSRFDEAKVVTLHWPARGINYKLKRPKFQIWIRSYPDFFQIISQFHQRIDSAQVGEFLPHYPPWFMLACHLWCSAWRTERCSFRFGRIKWLLGWANLTNGGLFICTFPGPGSIPGRGGVFQWCFSGWSSANRFWASVTENGPISPRQHPHSLWKSRRNAEVQPWTNNGRKRLA